MIAYQVIERNSLIVILNHNFRSDFIIVNFSVTFIFAKCFEFTRTSFLSFKREKFFSFSPRSFKKMFKGIERIFSSYYRPIRAALQLLFSLLVLFPEVNQITTLS